MNGETYAIADAGGEHARVFPVRVERQHVGPLSLASPARAERMSVDPSLQSSGRASHALTIIAGGANRDQHPLVVVAEHDVSGGVAVAVWQVRDGLGSAGWLEVAHCIGKANDAIGV